MLAADLVFGDRSSRIMGEELRWQLRRLVDLHWQEWGGDSVVLEARSAQIYQLDPLAAAVMACLELEPRSVIEVAQLLADDVNLVIDSEFIDTVAGIVSYFHELGWVAPITQG